MKIPLPCKFGTAAICEGKELPFIGVTWFQWSHGIEYTYYFLTKDYWHPVTFYTSDGTDFTEFVELPDILMQDIFFKDRGFPLKGKGYAMGIFYEKNRMYIDLILTDKYFAHVHVECKEKFQYQAGGHVKFPANWDKEKKENTLLKSFDGVIE